MTAATLARLAADRDAAIAEGGPDLDAYDPPATQPAAEAGPVTVTIPASGPGTPDSTVTLSRLDYSELRRLRGEGVSWAELKRRFKLPGQVLRAVAGDVDPKQGAKDRAAAKADTAKATSRPATQRQPTGARPRTDGKPRRRTATYEENLAMARRVHAGEPAAKVAEDTGFATSTVLATYRWAKREQLLDVEEANR